MEPLSIGEIVTAVNGRLVFGNTENTVSSICIDSRTCKPGDLFVPIKGQKIDSHMFITELLDSGISCCFTESGYSINTSKGALIEVSDNIKALQKLAKYYRGKFNIPIVGITGSVGKSTTKEMISSVLSVTLNVLKSEGNQNGQIGLPLNIFRLQKEHQVAILEMGISEFGEMERLSDIAQPNIGVITNIGLSHIENFNTQENICLEKLKILKNYNGKYYLNGDNPFLSSINKNKFNNITYFGLNGVYPYRAEDISSTGENTNFVLVTKKFRDNITIPCLGIHNVYNALAAISVAMDMGLHIEDIKEGLKNYKGLEMRQQICKIGNITILDDSYNSSPDSVKSSISVLRSLNPTGKNIVVMADMLELGQRSAELHFNIGKYIALEEIDVIITVGEMAKNIYDGARTYKHGIKSIHCASNSEAADAVISELSDESCVLIKGSRGMHTEEIVKILKNSLYKNN